MGGGQNKADSVCELESILDSSEAMDCHDFDKSKSRNDNKKMDSSVSHSDSKIVELESGLCKPRAEISLERLSHKRGAGIADSSPQAESLKTTPFHITHIEPYPALLHSLLKQSDIDSHNTRILPHRLQEIDICIFEELEANDILFIDSTHIAKINSDVNRIFFEILPRLKSGVYIHFHDIFYPFSYPNDWLRDKNSWNEAYVLRAFLSFNSVFEIVFFNTCLNHLYKDEFAAALPLSQKNTGGSLWLRKK